MLTTSAFQGLYEYVKRTIDRAQYKVGGTYYNIPIHEKTYLSDGRLAIYLLIDNTVSGNITITEIRLFDTSGNVFLTKPESILKENAQEGVLYRFAFKFVEV